MKPDPESGPPDRNTFLEKIDTSINYLNYFSPNECDYIVASRKFSNQEKLFKIIMDVCENATGETIALSFSDYNLLMEMRKTQ